MTYQLLIRNNRYYLTQEYCENKHAIRKSTNNLNKIEKTVSELLRSAKYRIIKGNRLIIHCENAKIVIPNINEYLRQEKEISKVKKLTYDLFYQIDLYIKRLPKQTVKTIDRKIISTVLIGSIVISGFLVYCGNIVRASDGTYQEIVSEEPIDFQKYLERGIIKKMMSYEPVKEKTPSYNPEELTQEKRVEQAILLYKENNTFLASDMTEYAVNKISRFLDSESGKYVYQYAEQFGVDPYLLVAIAMKESSLNHARTCPNGPDYNNYGVGMFQHENPNGTVSITAYNFSTSEYETEIITMENAINLEKNIKMAAMRLQKSLTHYKGNVFLASQGYHWGNGITDLAVCEYADRIGSTYYEVIADFSDMGYLKDFEVISQDPNGYAENVDLSKYEGSALIKSINYIATWDRTKSKYGNANYIPQAFGYYLGTISQNRLLVDSKEVLSTVNLITNEIIKEDILKDSYHKN